MGAIEMIFNDFWTNEIRFEVIYTLFKKFRVTKTQFCGIELYLYLLLKEKRFGYKEDKRGTSPSWSF